ncbi:hypothetical protein IAT38_001804 [Cryptococcus sp. DSM 104549]
MRATTSVLAVSAVAAVAQAQSVDPLSAAKVALNYLSSDCQSAIKEVVAPSSGTGSCFHTADAATVLQSNGSLVAGIDSYLETFCSADPCSTNELTNATQSLIAGCSSDFSKFGIESYVNNQTLGYVAQLYPLAREIICLKTSSEPATINGTSGTTPALSNGTNPQNITSIIPDATGSLSALESATSALESVTSAGVGGAATAATSAAASAASEVTSAAASIAKRQASDSATASATDAAVATATESDAGAAPISATDSASGIDSATDSATEASASATESATDASAAPSASATAATGTDSGNSTTNGTESSGNSTADGEFCVTSLLTEVFTYLGSPNLTVSQLATIALGGNSSAIIALESIPVTAVCNDCIFAALALVETEFPDVGTSFYIGNYTLNQFLDATCNATGLEVSTNGTLPANVTASAYNSSFSYNFTDANSTHTPSSVAAPVPLASLIPHLNVTVGNTTLGFGNDSSSAAVPASISSAVASATGAAESATDSAAAEATSSASDATASATDAASAASETATEAASSASETASDAAAAATDSATASANPSALKRRWIGEQ